MKQGKKINRTPWTQEEEDYIVSIAETDHFSAVCLKYRHYAAKRKWPKRTNAGIRQKLRSNGLKTTPLYGGWSCVGLAKYLGINYSRVYSWISEQRLFAKKAKGSVRYRILESDLKAFAIAYPKLLGGVDLSVLRLFLDEDTISSIPAECIKTKPTPVYSTKTGRVYPSIAEAARNEYFSEKTVSICVKKERSTIDGTKFIKMERKAA